jgi:signal transduction histidine kinase
MRRRLPHSLRARLVVAMGVGAVLALSTAILSFNLLLRQALRDDANAVLRSRAADRLSSLSTVDGTLRVAETPDAAAPDTLTWVYGAGGQTLEQPPGSSALDDSAASVLGRGSRQYHEVAATDTLLYAVPVITGGRRAGTVVVGASLTPYERTAHDALIGSLALAGVLLVAMLVAARVLIARALAPVDRMTASAARWSHDDLDRRLQVEGDDELARLARTLNSFLDRLAASMRREQRFSAELSHELRTPLSHLLAELELAAQDEHTEEGRASLAAIRSSAERIERTLQSVMSAARAESALAEGSEQSVDVRAAAAHAIDAAQASAVQRGIRLRLGPVPGRVQAGTSAEVVERILGPLLENGVRHASSIVSVEVERPDGRITMLVHDDGPGVPPADRERIFDPGVRGDAPGTAGLPQGAGLGLPLARRLARAAGGDVECVPNGAGATFRVRLPLAGPDV